MVPRPIDATLVVIATHTGSSPLEREIKDLYTSEYLKVRGVPKALLPISGRPALSWWYDTAQKLFGSIYLVTNAHNYKHFERWASGEGLPRQQIVNCGFSQNAVADLALVTRVKNITSPIVTTSSELLFDPSDENEDFLQVLGEETAEPFEAVATDSSAIESIVALKLSQAAVSSLQSLQTQVANGEDTETVSHGNHPTVNNSTIFRDLYGFLPKDVKRAEIKPKSCMRYADDSVTLGDYNCLWKKALDHLITERHQLTGRLSLDDPIIARSYARVGLVGNPSDGYHGKTISVLISNFWAEITLIPREQSQVDYGAISILPNPVADPHHFSNLRSMAIISRTDGYDNGDRLLQACCKVFYEHCENAGLNISTQRGFKVLFETNIPRQVGLAGSSAIVNAFWKALMRFYGLTEQDISPSLQASLVLSVERDELGISAGLQDRVIQAFGGCVFMDFEKWFMERNGYGQYESIDIAHVPDLWMSYVPNPKDSGKMHNSVKQRWLAGEPEVVEAMQTFGSYAEQAKATLLEGNTRKLASLMRANFSLRRAIFGDAALGKDNLRMVEIGNAYNCAAKFSGSGGAVIGLWDGEEGQRTKDLAGLRIAMENEGYVFVHLKPTKGE
ncbi:hypothetical protein BZG36_04418 [Bifiguratus adelaidae]|uniref:GHMP kinase N-terminal domain-containing protein n=1 Tax=Bifiguratus adelaidae TaxID=1938954 RepID=A0A261XWR5_9FUNG|nr:hypothetical protein BZG36_04418 [Bifiguratus adelaidae]